MSVYTVKRKFAAWSLALTLAVLASLLLTSFVFAESDEQPATPAENEPAATESGGEAVAPSVETPAEVQPADEAAEPASESGEEDETPQDAPPAEPEGEAVDVVGAEPVEETGASVSPAEELCPESSAPEVEMPIEELETTLLEPAEVEETTDGIVDAAQLTGGDPYWTVGGTTYRVLLTGATCPDGTAGTTCWLSDTPISEALNLIETNGWLPSDKKLYVETGTYTENISFEGEWLSKMTGLIGIDGSAATIINGDLYFPELASGFTLSGFTINGGVQMDRRVAGNLTLQDLDIQNPDGPGIMIGEPVYDEENEWWSYYVNRGNVTLTNVNSSGNADAGAVIARIGNIKISDSTFNNNDLSGLSVDDFNQGALVVLAFMNQKAELVNVTANGNIANEGIHVYAGAGVVLNIVTANSNQAYDGIYVNSGTTANVTNVTTNNNLGGFGLYVYARTSATLNQVIAQGNEGENGESGISVSSNTVTLKNILASGTIGGDGIHVSAYSGKATLENIVSNDNDFSGMTVYGWGGTKPVLTLKNITANGNGEKGLWIDTEGGINVTNSLTDGNTEDGLYIVTSGIVKLTTIRSSGNDGNGLMISGQEVWEYDEELDDDFLVDILSPLAITITSPADSNFANIFDNNGGKGILIQSKNAVAISNFFARNNADEGVRVEGICIDLDCTKSGAVTIKSAITGFSNEVNGNGGIGISVEDSQGNIIIERTLVNNSDNIGILINTLGTITLKDVKSNNNRESGLYLINSDATKAIPITLTNIEASGSLEYNGIYARSKGLITLNNVIANNNAWSGADLDNCLLDDGSGLCLGSGTITITNASGKLNTFNDNGRFGVWVVSKGAITVTNIQANNNGSDGASLKNNYGGSSANVTVAVSGTTRNEFNGNGWNSSYSPVDDYYRVSLNGLFVKTFGNIIVKNAQAQNNQNEGGGIVVRNDISTTPKTVLISDCEVSGNDWHGLFVYSKGNITLTNIGADTNHLSGVFADNCLYDDGTGTCGGTGKVTLTNVTSNDNWSRGIEVYSKGVITLTNGTALENTGDEGVFLENNYTGSTAGVTLKTVTANGNNNSGMLILTNGAVTLNNITANNNHRLQGWLDDGQTAQDWYNAEQGDDRWSFYLEAGTAYTISMLGSGVGVTNLSTFVAMMNLYAESAPETVIDSGGTINFTPGTSGWYYVLVNNNDGTDGMYRISLAGENTPNPGIPDMMYWVDGVAVVAGGNITLKNGTFDDNSLSGLYAESSGNIIISNVGGSQNGTDGFDLYNNGGIGNVTLTGTNLANSNGWYGVDVRTNGVLSLTNLETSYNGQYGVRIDAQGAGKAVTLKGITVMENLLDGLNISTNGKLTLNDIRSWLNGGSGAVLDTNGNALLVQASVFMCNGEYGLEYKDYVLPFTFTDKANVYFGNTSGGIHTN
jgi:hypothetical protein